MRKTILLPGMGADSNMYPKTLYRHLSGVDFVDWPPYQGETTIPALARRMIDEYGITPACIVGGASLGGMVAVEIARLLNSDRVILIGSTTHTGAIQPALMRLSGFAHLAHVAQLQWLAGKVNRGGNNLFLSMFEKADGDFMKAMAQAIVHWRGMDGHRCHVHHIHGARDKVILPPSRGATIIPDAGHLLPMTHAGIVARFIERHTLAQTGSP
jgi:pimeloyl-ACP methyl ester carboxylesterase